MVMAFVNLRQQKMPEARKWLARIRTNQLWPRQRGYYNFLMGSLTMEENMNIAEKFLKDAKRLDTKGVLAKDIKMVEDAIKGGGARTSVGGRGGSPSSARQARRSKAKK